MCLNDVAPAKCDEKTGTHEHTHICTVFGFECICSPSAAAMFRGQRAASAALLAVLLIICQCAGRTSALRMPAALTSLKCVFGCLGTAGWLRQAMICQYGVLCGFRGRCLLTLPSYPSNRMLRVTRGCRWCWTTQPLIIGEPETGRRCRGYTCNVLRKPPGQLCA